MAYPFTLPGRSIVGAGALENSGQHLRALGKKALIVTGKNVSKSGAVTKLTDLLDRCEMSYQIFSEITGEPTDVMINEGVMVYLQEHCDCLIGIGGGSPLDSAKAIAAMTVLPGILSDYVGQEIIGDFPPFALIPTTAGTGSEATKFTVITDTARDVKMLLKGDALLPALAIVDPAFALTAPASVVAATGMDALTHAVESFTSRKGNPMTDFWALDAIKRIFRNLVPSYQDPSNLEAREEMALAAYQAGVCINNASVTLVHGMSRPIGAIFHVPHGISNAMLISACMDYALDGCYEKFATIARAIGAAEVGTTDEEAAKAFTLALAALVKTLEIPTLAEYGIDRSTFAQKATKMADDALASGSPQNTIKEVSKEAILAIYETLWH